MSVTSCLSKRFLEFEWREAVDSFRILMSSRKQHDNSAVVEGFLVGQ